MSVPAPLYGSFAPPPNPLRNEPGLVTFALGLMVAFGLVAWLAAAALAGVGGAIQHVGGAVTGAAQPTGPLPPRRWPPGPSRRPRAAPS